MLVDNSTSQAPDCPPLNKRLATILPVSYRVGYRFFDSRTSSSP